MSKINKDQPFRLHTTTISLEKDEIEPDFDLNNIPVLPLRGAPVFSMVLLPINLGRESSVQLCQEALESKKAIALIAQINPEKETPGKRDLYPVGVLATVMDTIHMPDGSMSAVIKTGPRVKLGAIKSRSPYLRAAVTMCDENLPEDKAKLSVVVKTALDIFNDILGLVDNNETTELRKNIENMENVVSRINFISTNAPLSNEDKIKLLSTDNVLDRYEMLCKMLNDSLQFLKLRAELQSKTAEQLNSQQREHFLQQQIRVIQDELGNSVEDEDAKNLESRARKMVWSKEAKKHFEKELRKLDRFNVQNPEYSIQYQYLDTYLTLPWDKLEKKPIDVSHVKEVLEEDHYGLEEVKERIMEHVAVLKLRNDMRAPILCLYGPPGVGKTSLGKSIARALGREYARISLGGLHDEAEIRGHRRTYIGAMPGRIISALKCCKTNNPVIVLDEVDKIGKDFKGDPSTALLEVLDPEQNNHFHDNYIDFDYDLSKIMFIATANDLSGISRPLLDRMELIEINGYVTEEKVEIGLRHLVKKMLEQHGFQPQEVNFTSEALRDLINGYTRESGVRLLEKKIAKVVRKLGILKATGQSYPTLITPKEIAEYMGSPEVIPDECSKEPEVGTVTGLAWTSVGGEILFIESALIPGKGDKLTLTGNLGDVMKESAQIALQYLKANAERYVIAGDILEKHDIHVHVPEGAIPKDGPSAGITITTALASVLTGRKVKPCIAMTGEVTLRGKVLPVGGIKEKILAAKRAGATEIILCEDNRKDVEKIPSQYLDGLSFHYVKSVDEVLALALI